MRERTNERTKEWFIELGHLPVSNWERERERVCVCVSENRKAVKGLKNNNNENRLH